MNRKAKMLIVALASISIAGLAFLFCDPITAATISTLVGFAPFAVNISDGELLGLDAVLVYNTGTHAIPVWVTVARVKDLSAPNTKNAAELNSRASNFNFYKGALRVLGVDFGYLYRRGTDTVFTALNDSFINGTALEFWCGDGAITLTGAKGWRFYAEVFDMSREQPLEEGEVWKVGIKPTPFYVSGAQVFPDFFIVP